MRGVAGGLRYVALAGGAVETAASFLPTAAADVHAVALPARLHGGFAFLAGRSVFHADSWTGEAVPVLDAAADVTALVPGLDRLYITFGRGEQRAVDPVSFAPTELGRLPDAPSFLGYAAFDGWHAAAIADLRGVVETRDAGATWQAIALPAALVPTAVRATDEGFVVTGRAPGGDRSERSVALDLDGHVTAISPATADADASASSEASSRIRALAADGPFGARPLAAAIEDGWPLADGTALVLRAGLFARIALPRGEIVETFAAAIAEDARCHPLALGREGGATESADEGASASVAARLGFVCGREHGDTWLYTFDPARRTVRPFGHFRGPRAVLAPGNGRIAVHGSCDERAPDAPDVYCLSAASLGDWRELRLEGALDGERVVPLGRGGIAVLSPAHGDLARMRLTVRDERGVSTARLRVHAAKAQADAPLSPGVAAVLRSGVWLDGVRETSPGVLAAWVDGHGSMLGLSIALDGSTTHGDWVRDLGSPFVAGPFGLGMSPARRGYQTVDGGMHWTAFDAPPPLVPSAAVDHRACGPVGCSALGWLRLGWGEARDAAPAVFPGASHLPTVTGAGQPRVASPNVGCRVVGRPLLRETPAPKTPLLDEWTSFFGVASPKVAPGSRGGAFPARAQLGREIAAQVYVWGPKDAPTDALDATAIPPELQPHWMIRWASPFAAGAEVRTSSIAPVPAPLLAVLDPATRTGVAGTYSFVAGETADEALLFRDVGATGEVYELATGRPPLLWRDAAGAPPPALVAATHAAGRWYAASAGAAGEPGPPRTVLWTVEHGVLRKLAVVPRFVAEGHRANVHLARRDDDRAVALVVTTDGTTATWAVPFDLTTGALGEPESLGAFDPSQASVLVPCGASGPAPGWVLDLDLGVHPRTLAGADPEPQFLGSPVGRLHLRGIDPIPGAHASVCLERMVASLSDEGLPVAPSHPDPSEASQEIPVLLNSPLHRTFLACRTLR